MKHIQKKKDKEDSKNYFDGKILKMLKKLQCCVKD
jgi:hypothetical protein